MAVTLSTSYQKVAEKYLGNSAGNVYIRAYAKYSSQDAVNNKSKGVTVQLRVYYDGPYIDCGVWKFTGYGDYYSSSQAVNNEGDIVQGSNYGTYRFTTGETTIATSAGIDVSHNTNGTKSITMGCWGSFTSWGWEGSSGYQDVNLPAIDRSGTTFSTINCVATSNTQISLSVTTADTCDSWEYSLDGNAWVNFSSTEGTSATGTITVTEGIHTIQIQAKKKSNQVWTKTTTQTIDTILPQVSFSVTNIGTDSITINATSNIASINWGYSKNGGTSYTDLIYQTGTGHHEYTFTGLDINTEYPIRVRVKNPANDLYGYSNIVIVKTQGGIVHVPVNNVWKDALVYVVVENTWKQAIAYTVFDNNWRIGT